MAQPIRIDESARQETVRGGTLTRELSGTAHRKRAFDIRTPHTTLFHVYWAAAVREAHGGESAYIAFLVRLATFHNTGCKP